MSEAEEKEIASLEMVLAFMLLSLDEMAAQIEILTDKLEKPSDEPPKDEPLADDPPKEESPTDEPPKDNPGVEPGKKEKPPESKPPKKRNTWLW